jgi:hypothetical protein
LRLGRAALGSGLRWYCFQQHAAKQRAAESIAHCLAPAHACSQCNADADTSTHSNANSKPFGHSHSKSYAQCDPNAYAALHTCS